MRYKIVYRVQLRTDNTVGPYRRWLEMHCDPSQTRRLLSRPFIQTSDYISPCMYFGFPHKRSLYRWFTKRDLVSLRRAGYCIAKYRVLRDKVLMDQRETATQCAFPLYEAKLLEAA